MRRVVGVIRHEAPCVGHIVRLVASLEITRATRRKVRRGDDSGTAASLGVNAGLSDVAARVVRIVDVAAVSLGDLETLADATGMEFW